MSENVTTSKQVEIDFLIEYKKAILIRTVETKLLDLFKQGLLNGTVHTCVGQELVGVFVSKYLTEEDHVCSNHRGHGHYISKTGKVRELLSELLGKKSGSCHGIGGSQHLYDKGYLSNGVQAGMTPIAAGIAFDFKLKKKDSISVVYIGDGTLGEGLLYEVLNIAAKWELPILFVLENNGYAQSTSMKQTFAGVLEERIKGFGLEYSKANIWDVKELDSKARDAVSAVRKGTPRFLEIECYRLNSHSKGDDNRDKDVVSEYFEKDPINIFMRQEAAVASKLIEESDVYVNALVEDILANDEDLDEFDNLPQYHNKACLYNQIKVGELSGEKYNNQLYAALKALLERKNTIILGEDIENNNEYNTGNYGGAFKVTKDLSNLFREKVINTPISEAAITGIGIGLAIAGNIAIAEIMFGDFTTLAFDQLLQHASKFYGMTKGNVSVPFILRTPMGGYRGYGPTHSQSIEKHFLGIPYLNVIALNKYVDPSLVYRAMTDDCKSPSFVIENKILYTKQSNSIAPQLDYYLSDEQFPTVLIRPRNVIADLTIFCYGGMLEEAEPAVEFLAMHEDIFCEVIVPVSLSPLNIWPVLNSVSKTRKLLCIEEGSNIASLSGTVVSALLQESSLRFDYLTMATNNIIPSAAKAEKNVLPTTKAIIDKVKKYYNI